MQTTEPSTAIDMEYDGPASPSGPAFYRECCWADGRDGARPSRCEVRVLEQDSRACTQNPESESRLQAEVISAASAAGDRGLKPAGGFRLKPVL